MQSPTFTFRQCVRYLRSSEMTSLFARISDLALFMRMDPQGSYGQTLTASQRRKKRPTGAVNTAERNTLLHRISRCSPWFCHLHENSMESAKNWPPALKLWLDS